ncbi:hypothetical protein [Nocardioides dongxiaopingii]|nr:hypothetical protein [Nocardioides dongxiaopingii]
MAQPRFTHLPEPVRLEDTVTSEDEPISEPVMVLVEDGWFVRNAGG